jgi:DNA-binding MarR family transcriptional regulator
VDNPGVSATEIAREWNKTRSTVTQTLLRLERKKLIKRGKDKFNDKKVLYSPTELGLEIHKLHKKYDEYAFGVFINPLLKLFSREDVEKTFEVLKKYVELHRQ